MVAAEASYLKQFVRCVPLFSLAIMAATAVYFSMTGRQVLCVSDGRCGCQQEPATTTSSESLNAAHTLQREHVQVLRPNDVDDFAYPSAAVLKNKSLAQALDAEFFRKEFFPYVGLVPSPYSCKKSWEEAKDMGQSVHPHMKEMLQEVGFVTFFNSHYPFVSASHSTRDRESLLFLPFCLYTENTHPREGKLRNKKNGLDNLKQGFAAATDVINGEDVDRLVRGLLDTAIGSRIFYISQHPLIKANWGSVIRRVRALLVDKTAGAATHDLVVPQSVEERFCASSSVQPSSRKTLLALVGRNVPKNTFANLRNRIREGLSELRVEEGEIDASTWRTPHEYDAAFSQSKFCAVVPGDTMSTSQGARAMCAQCVPVFIVNEFRDLPFANILNYSAFSVRRHIETVTGPDGVRTLYNDLRHLVASGQYLRLFRNVGIAKNFFNYHSFKPKSPYGAALLAIQEDMRVQTDF